MDKDLIEFSKLFNDFKKFLVSAEKEIHKDDSENAKLTDAWLNQVLLEDNSAKSGFKNAHQKAQANEAEKEKLEKELELRQRELIQRKDEKVAKRRMLESARKLVEEKKSDVENAMEILDEQETGVKQAKEELELAEKRLKSILASCKEQLKLDIDVNGKDVTVAFTNISPADPGKIHFVSLKTLKSSYKVTACKPAIEITKRELDDLHKNDCWMKFLFNVRASFLKLYDS